MRTSFEVLDADNDGVITAEDIARASRGRLSLTVAQEILEEAAQGKEAEIDFEKVRHAAAVERLREGWWWHRALLAWSASSQEGYWVVLVRSSGCSGGAYAQMVAQCFAFV